MLLLAVEAEVTLSHEALLVALREVREQEPCPLRMKLPAPPLALNVAPVDERE